MGRFMKKGGVTVGRWITLVLVCSLGFFTFGLLLSCSSSGDSPKEDGVVDDDADNNAAMANQGWKMVSASPEFAKLDAEGTGCLTV